VEDTAETKAAAEDASDCFPMTEAECRLMDLSFGLVTDYVRRVKRGEPAEADSPPLLGDVVVALLEQGWMCFSAAQVGRHLPGFYAGFMQLVRYGSPEVRAVLSDFLHRRLGSLVALSS